MHLHPVVFRILLAQAARWGIRAVRLTHDPLRVDLQLGRGRWPYRLSHAAVYGSLTRWAKPFLRRAGIDHTARVFGLLQTGAFNENYLLNLLQVLPAGTSEIYCHPCMQLFRCEFDALVSPSARRIVDASQIHLIRYQDL
jgi:hypothetical protein